EADLATEGTGSAARPAPSSENPLATLLPGAASGPLILRSAEAFRQTIQDLQNQIEADKRTISQSRQAVADPQLDKGKLESLQYNLKVLERELPQREQELAFVRDEYATQIRLLEIGLQDAQSKVTTAKENAHRVESLFTKGFAPPAEVESARQAAASA